MLQWKENGFLEDILLIRQKTTIVEIVSFTILSLLILIHLWELLVRQNLFNFLCNEINYWLIGGAVPYNYPNNFGTFSPPFGSQELKNNNQPNSAPPVYYPNQLQHPSFPNFNIFPFGFNSLPHSNLQGQNNGASIQGQHPNQNHQQVRLNVDNQPQPIPTSADDQIAGNQIKKKENATVDGHWTVEDEMNWEAPTIKKKFLNLNCTLPASDVLKPWLLLGLVF